jgi:hypothetical protein
LNTGGLLFFHQLLYLFAVGAGALNIFGAIGDQCHADVVGASHHGMKIAPRKTRP